MFYEKGILKTFSKFRGKNKKQSSRCSVNKVFPKTRRKNPVQESLFIKADGLKACNIVRKRLYHRYFCILYVLQNDHENLFVQQPLTITSGMTLFFFSFWRSMRCNFFGGAMLHSKKGINKPVKFCMVMETSWELYLPSGHFNSFKEKEDDDLQCAFSSFIKITLTCFFTSKTGSRK